MPLSGDYRIDSILQSNNGNPVKWGGAVGSSTIVTYAFGNAPPDVTAYGTNSANWTPLTAAQRDAERKALHAWADISGIILVELPDYMWRDADIDIHMASIGDPGIAAFTYYPGSNSLAGRMVFDKDLYARSAFTAGSYDYMLMLHESGHAFGLKHPFDAGIQLPASENNLANTVMGYDTSPGSKPSSLGNYDVMAIRYLYGDRDAYFSELSVTASGTTGFNISGNGWTKYLPKEVISVTLGDGRMILSDRDIWFQVDRLYEIAFNRDPLGFETKAWLNYMNQGHNLGDVAQGLLNSFEFSTKHANLSNTQFLYLAYDQLFDRTPDAGGLQNWLNYLQTSRGDRAGVFTSLVNSNEAYLRSTWDGQVRFDPDSTKPALDLLWKSAYATSFLPQPVFSSWLSDLKSGAKSLLSISQEFFANYPALSQMPDNDFVKMLYQNSYQRDAAPQEINYWLNEMSQKHTDRAWLVTMISQQQEAQIAYESLYHDGGIQIA